MSMKIFSKKGFTLVETMIAVTILTLSVTAPLFSASRALVVAEISRDQLTASYLAQEGIEYMRWMRDDEYLAAFRTAPATASTDSWNYFINGGGSNPSASINQCVSPKICTLDPALSMGYNSSLATYGDNAQLYLNNGIYTQQQIGTKTAFTRTVQAVTITSIDERIVSTVSWSFHGTPYSVTVTDHLTPWQ